MDQLLLKGCWIYCIVRSTHVSDGFGVDVMLIVSSMKSFSASLSSSMSKGKSSSGASFSGGLMSISRYGSRCPSRTYTSPRNGENVM